MYVWVAGDWGLFDLFYVMLPSLLAWIHGLICLFTYDTVDMSVSHFFLFLCCVVVSHMNSSGPAHKTVVRV